MKTTFPEKLRNLRTLYKLKQSELGKLLGMSINQISAHERKVSNPNLDFVLLLAQFFNKSIEDFTNIPAREEFFVDAVVDQEERQIDYILNSHDSEVFAAKSGLIPISLESYTKIGILKEFPEVATNFLLLNTLAGKVISSFFEDKLQSLPQQEENDFFVQPPLPSASDYIEGYPLLVELYQKFNRRSWLGQPVTWPTRQKNILALQLSTGKIIRLYISPIAEGCKLYAAYNKQLENYINSWFEMNVEERRSMAIKYYISTYSKLTKLELDGDNTETISKIDIRQKKDIYGKIIDLIDNNDK